MNKLIFIIGKIFSAVFEKLTKKFLMLFLTSCLTLGTIWIISYTLELNNIKTKVEYKGEGKAAEKVYRPNQITKKDSLYYAIHLDLYKFKLAEAEDDRKGMSNALTESVSWIKELLTWLIGLLNGIVGLIYMIKKLKKV